MKITIKKKIPTSISFNPKHKPKYKTIDEVTEIPDELVDKTIAVIDELLDRTIDDLENRSWSGVEFPLVPFPFFHKYREPEDIGIYDYWIGCWLSTGLQKVIIERTKIIETLNRLGTIEEIKHHPVQNLTAGIFNGEEFNLIIKREKLSFLRKLIIDKQQNSINDKKNTDSLIRKTALQNIANEIKELATHGELSDFFDEFNIPKQLHIEGSKYNRVLSVLANISQKELFRIIEETVHPLRFFGGDEEQALQIQDLFTTFLQYDGYCIRDGKIIKSTPKILKEVKTRISKRTNQAQKKLVETELGDLRERVNDAINEEIKGASTTISPTEPLPIRIVGDIGIKGFEEKVVLPKSKKKKIQLRKFPANLKWEEISIQFLNEHEVIVTAQKEVLQITYEAMGFQDEKRKLPNKSWQFLQLLAIKNGEVNWDNNQDMTIKKVNAIKKRVQLLSDDLKAYFQITNSNPFDDYKKDKSYRIKIILIPEKETQDTT